MVVLGWLVAIAAAIGLIALGVVFLNRFYRKSTRDIALVRTGFGGQRIIISGGCLALPFLHKVDERSTCAPCASTCCARARSR